MAAIGLINMGNRSIPCVLQALTERAESKGFRDASHTSRAEVAVNEMRGLGGD